MTHRNDDHDDEELAELRRRVERKALLTAERMLDDAATPATARASVLRAVLGDAAARRHDLPADASDPTMLDSATLRRMNVEALRQMGYVIGPGPIEDATLIEAQPARSGVFD